MGGFVESPPTGSRRRDLFAESLALGEETSLLRVLLSTKPVFIKKINRNIK
jgi:hypothetical protein